MTSGFYRNSESVCGLQQKNVLALSSMVFISTACFHFYLFHNNSSLTPYLSPSFTEKLEILSGFPHPVLISLPGFFPQTAPCSRSSRCGLSSLPLTATFHTHPLPKHRCSISEFLILILSLFYSLLPNFLSFIIFSLLTLYGSLTRWS